MTRNPFRTTEEAFAMRVKVIAVAISAITLLGSSLAAAETAIAAPESTTAQATAVSPMATGASRLVTGYSLHAEQEMAADGIGSDYVENVVYNYYKSAVKQSNGRYKYTDKKIVVIAEPSGYVVTVWRL